MQQIEDDNKNWNKNTMDEASRSRTNDSRMRFRSLRNARLSSGIETEWAENLALYAQDADGGVSGTWRSDAFVPHATREVHAITPHLTAAILEAEQLLSLTPMNEDSLQYAKVEEKVLTHQLTQKMQFPDNWEIFNKQLAIQGTSVAFVGWAQMFGSAEVEVLKSGEDGGLYSEMENQQVTVDGHNTFMPIDISDVWVDVNSVAGQPVKRLFHYQRLSRRQMEQMGVFVNLDNLTISPPSVTEFLRQTLRADDPNSIGSQRQSNSADWMGMNPYDIPHHIMFEWDAATGTFSAVADDFVEILPPTPFPFKHGKMPYVFAWYEFIPGRFYGKGAISFIAKSCRQANRLRRQRDDNVELAINKMFVLRTGSIMNEQEELKIRPAGIIHMRGPIDQLQQLPMADVTMSAYQDEQIIKADIQDVNGITNAFMGIGDSSARTATGTISNQRQSQLRVNGVVRHSVEAFRQSVEMMVSNDQQFIAPMQKEHLVGQTAMIYGLYGPEMQQGQVVLNVNPAKLYDNSDIKNQQFINGLMIMGKMGLASYLDMSKIANLMVTRILGVDDPRQVMAAPLAGTATDFMRAQARAEAMAQIGQPIPPQPGENNLVNKQVFELVSKIHPQLAPLMDAAIQMEDMAIQQQNMQMAGLLPPGEDGQQPENEGGANDPSNPARMPSMTSATGAVRSNANVKAGGNRTYR